MQDIVRKTEQGVSRSREGFFSRITGLFNRTRIEESTWDELEELLISADVGMETTGKLLDRVRKRARDEKLVEGSLVRTALKEEMTRLLDVPARAGVGISATGKKVLLGAADTFRAAAIDQLKMWGERVGVDVVAHQPGADPGAVVFDTLDAARSRGADVIIIDTAGRLQTKHNLMDELKKIRKVSGKYDAEHEVLLVIDATTGQNGLSQARSFTEATDVSGILLSKLDGTARGGIVLAICDQLQIPIKYMGVGEQIGDIAPFDPASFVNAIFEEVA